MLGGPLHRLGCTLGLVRDGTNTIRLGIAIGLLAWAVLLALALIEGVGLRLFSVPTIGIHVRFLLVVPLLFVCETWVVPRMAAFARAIVSSGLVPAESVGAWASNIRWVNRIEYSWLAESFLLLVALAVPLIEVIAPIPGKTSSWVSILQTAGRIPWTTAWYLGFCLPIFRFLLLRWLWRLGLWWYLLWRLEKLELRLLPTHPDGVGGLGGLDTVHECFSPLVLANSALYSTQFAEDISTGSMPFDALYGWFFMVLLLNAALFIAPLSMFCATLWKCRVQGLSDYMGMAYRYVNAFDRKWIRGDPQSSPTLLGTPDLQSLADLTNGVRVVREMRWIPVGKRLVKVLTVAAITPMLPLLFLKYPVDQMVVKFFHVLTGL